MMLGGRRPLGGRGVIMGWARGREPGARRAWSGSGLRGFLLCDRARALWLNYRRADAVARTC